MDSLARGYQDPHFVEAKPSFILRLQKADLLIVVGRELEIGWLPPLVQQSRNAKIRAARTRYLDASRSARILDIPTGQVTRAMGDVHPKATRHTGSIPERPIIAQAIQGRLAAIRPTDAAYFVARYDRFRQAAGRGREALGRGDGALQGRESGDVPSLVEPNFVDRFGLDVIGYVEPRPGIPPSPAHTLL